MTALLMIWRNFHLFSRMSLVGGICPKYPILDRLLCLPDFHTAKSPYNFLAEQVDSLLSKKSGIPDKLFYWYYFIVQDTMKVVINNLTFILVLLPGA